jgi:septal ring factor EnvC (AmiA/AmiB activator)
VRIAFFLLLFFPLIAFAQTNTNLKEVKDRISQEEKALKALTGQKNTTVKQLESLMRKSYNERRAVTLLNNQIANNNAHIRKLKAEEAELKRKAKVHEDQARQGMIFMVDSMEGRNAQVLLAGGDPKKIATTIELLDRLSSTLSVRIREYLAASARVATVTKEISDENKRLSANRTDKEQLAKQYATSQQELSRTITLIRQDEQARKEYLAMLKKEQEAINKALRESAKRKAYIAATSFAKQRGKLPRPMQGRVIEQFGERLIPEAGVTIMHKGIKIAPTGDGVVHTVAAGQVIFIDYINGTGNIIIVQHDKEYYTVYANLDEFVVSISETLQKNAPIGRIDVDLKENSSYLYFEIRRHEDALNPQQWLMR